MLLDNFCKVEVSITNVEGKTFTGTTIKAREEVFRLLCNSLVHNDPAPFSESASVYYYDLFEKNSKFFFDLCNLVAHVLIYGNLDSVPKNMVVPIKFMLMTLSKNTLWNKSKTIFSKFIPSSIYQLREKLVELQPSLISHFSIDIAGYQP